MTKYAVVTGAGSGVGRAAALALLADGWTVALAGRRADALAETAGMAGNATPRAIPVPTDVGDPASVNALFDKLKADWGRLDFLFNNAGGNVPAGPIEDLKYEDWARVVQVNLTGSFLCAQAAFRMMKSQDPIGGRIVNNGSISAHVPRPNSVAYTSTKHAITGLTKTLALDGRPFEIACGQIDIGNAVTEMTAAMASGVRQADGSLQAEDRMDVGHVADAVFHMASLPLGANVLFTTIMASKMPLVGRG